MARKQQVGKQLYYKIGEACKLLDIQPYVLRYWETEFPVLAPTKSKSGQRVYSAKEIELIRRIKELLYEEGYTIAGAKKKLESELAEPARESVAVAPEKKEKAAEATGIAESLDTSAAERLKTLREALAGAVREAKEILALIDSGAS